MTPYALFSFCQNCQRRNAGTIRKFEESDHFEFFCALRYYFMEKLKIKSDRNIKKFIEVCVKETGENFSPFQLNSPEYLHIFKEWYKKNSNKGLYFISINESFKNIYKFCSDKKIETLEEYTKKWAVSHIISGILNENIAYALGVHELVLSKPEVMMINKKFLKNKKLIQERIDRELKLKTVLSEGIQDLKKKLIWRNEKV
jgi:hypothetical protein